ncbi:MAG: hypothetical protein ACE5GK_12100 [Nitrospiria bacterium]
MHFDPYFTFRLILSLFFFGYILYDLIDLILWLRGLPRVLQRMILLKLLTLRSTALRIEICLILLLASIEGWLMFTFLRGI